MQPTVFPEEAADTAWRRWQASGAPTQRVDYWKHVVCEAVLDVQMTPRRANAERPFHGHIVSRDQAGARFVNFRSGAHQVHRTARHADHADDQFLMISLQTRGISRLLQQHGEVQLAKGDIGILDSVRPFTIDFPEDVERRILLLPRNLLRARLPSIGNWQGPQRMSAESALTRILGQQLQVLTSRDHGLADPMVQTLLGGVADMLAAHFSQSQVPLQSSEAAFARACGVIDTRLCDSDLTPAKIAAAMGLSLRSLQRLFQRHAPGVGVEAYLVERRLQHAHRLLEQRTARNVSEAAFASGFADLSHFSRRFQARFGCMPSVVLRGEARASC